METVTKHQDSQEIQRRKKPHGNRWFSSKALRCCAEFGLGAQPPDKGLCVGPDAPVAQAALGTIQGLVHGKSVCVSGCIYPCKKLKR